jgi:hypothetical protein|tara:strand:+ start:974 stop:1342 length:369 start_codon:yes stop_codon:yes gene_type:complete
MDLSKVQQLRDVKAQLSDLNSEVKALSVIRAELEEGLLGELSDGGVTLARTEFGTVSVLKATVPNVQDWVVFETYVYENNAMYLMQRRLSAPAFRDEIESKGDIPGVTTFEKKTISLTNASK